MNGGRALVTRKVVDHLAKLLGMVGSWHDGEALNAARLADAFVRALGLTWRDVLADPPDEWQTMLKLCCDNAQLLTDREHDFIRNLVRLRHPPSDRQLRWLQDIFERLSREAA